MTFSIAFTRLAKGPARPLCRCPICPTSSPLVRLELADNQPRSASEMVTISRTAAANCLGGKPRSSSRDIARDFGAAPGVPASTRGSRGRRSRRSTPASRNSLPMIIRASRTISTTEAFSIRSASHGGASSPSSHCNNRSSPGDSPPFAYCSSQRRNRSHRLSSIRSSTSTSASRESSPSKSREKLSADAGRGSNPAANDCRSRNPSTLIASISTEPISPTFNDDASCAAKRGQRSLRSNSRGSEWPAVSASSPSSARQDRIKSPGRPSGASEAPTSDAANARAPARARWNSCIRSGAGGQGLDARFQILALLAQLEIVEYGDHDGGHQR